MALDLDEFDSDSAEIRGDIPASVTYNAVVYSSGTVSTAPRTKDMDDSGFTVMADLIWVINRSAFAAVTAPDLNTQVTYGGVNYRVIQKEDYVMATDTKYSLKRQT